MKLLDLFSGIGGFHLGLEQSGFKFDWVGFSEIDKYASKQYKKRFPDATELGSVTDIQCEQLPKNIDILCGGFPCQSFSIAGLRGGFEDTRGTLFFEIVRILQHYKDSGNPINHFILENVKGLLSHDDGRTFAIIYRVLTDLNYSVECQLLNTRWFLPQNRERIYIVGHSRGESRRKVFPIREIGNEVNELQGQFTNTLKARYEAIGDGSYIIEGEQYAQEVMAWSKSHRTGSSDADKKRKNYGKVEHRIKTDEFNTLSTGKGCSNMSSANYVKEEKKIRIHSPKVKDIQPYLRKWLSKSNKTIKGIERIFDNQAAHHWFEKIKFASLPKIDDWLKLKEILKFDDKYDKIMTEHKLMTEWDMMQEHKKRHQEKGHGFGVVEKAPGDIGSALTSFSERTDALHINNLIRRLTPTECERLQGFPDGWTEGQSDTQRYKQLGNAVSVPVVKAVGDKLISIYG